MTITVSQNRIDGIVAIVGSYPVLHSDVLQQTQIIAAGQGVDPIKRPYLFEEIYLSSLHNLINQYVVLVVAEKDTNIIVSDDDVDRALDQRIDEFILQAGSVGLFEEMIGMSLRQVRSEYWREIRNMMYIEKYKFSLIQNVDVSRIEVDSFYDKYRDSISFVPEQFNFSVVEVPFVSGKSSDNFSYNFLDSLRSLIINSGLSFDSLAIKHSQDPATSSSGGRLGFTARGNFLSSYEEAAFSLNSGEISMPVRSKLGYHLIRVLERRGEKISTQHIFLKVAFSKKDREISLKKAQSIYFETNNDPFVFDSLSLEYANLYNNFSGKYSNIKSNDMPPFILEKLRLLKPFVLSSPIESINGYVLIYLYKHIEKYYPNIDNSWSIIYEYAKQEKQNRMFLDKIEKIKMNTYIKTFYD